MRTVRAACVLPVVVALFWNSPAHWLHGGQAKPVVTTHPRGFTIETPRLSATVEDGMIVDLRNTKTGELHADRRLKDYAIPRGMGHLTGDAFGFALETT